MRFYAAALFFLSLTFVHAQSDSTAKASRWSIGAFGLMDQCFRTLVNTGNDPDMDRLIDFRNGDEIMYTRYSGMLMLQYDLGRHWQLSTGLGYFCEGFRTKDMSDWHAIDNPADDPAILDLTSRSFIQYNYLALPIIVAYHVGHARCEPFVALGVAPEVLLKDRYIFEEEQNGNVRRTESHYEGSRDFGLAACGQLGADCRVSDHFSLRIAACGRYGIIDIIDAPITAHLWSMGGLLGVSYRL